MEQINYYHYHQHKEDGIHQITFRVNHEKMSFVWDHLKANNIQFWVIGGYQTVY